MASGPCPGNEGLVPAGSTFRVGFSTSNTSTGLADMIEGCLYASGLFSEISVNIGGGYFSTYITIYGRTAIDFAKKDDIGGACVEWLGQCVAADLLVNPDPTCIDSVPAASAGQTGVIDITSQDRRVTNVPSGPGQCSGLPFGDWLACETGFTKSTSLLLGVAVTLGVLFAISRR